MYSDVPSIFPNSSVASFSTSVSPSITNSFIVNLAFGNNSKLSPSIFVMLNNKLLFNLISNMLFSTVGPSLNSPEISSPDKFPSASATTLNLTTFALSAYPKGGSTSVNVYSPVMYLPLMY